MMSRGATAAGAWAPGLATVLLAAVGAMASAVAAGAAAAVLAGAAQGRFTDRVAGLREEVVLSGALIDGNRLDLTRFRDERPAQALLEEVRRVWSSRPAPIHSSTRDGWLVATQVVGTSVEVFEVRSRGGGAEGRRSRLSRGDSALAGASAWLETMLPEGSESLGRITHADGGRQLTTLVAVTSVSATAALHELASAFARRGFRNGPHQAASLAGSGAVLFLSRGSEEVAVTISERDGRRAVVMHWGRNVR